MERLGSHVKTNLCLRPERIPNGGRSQNSSVWERLASLFLASTG